MKTVLITGACKNTGVDIVKKFAMEGYTVFFTGRNEDSVKAAEKEYKKDFPDTVIKGIVINSLINETTVDKDSVYNLFSCFDDENIIIDTLVLNAADQGLEMKIFENPIEDLTSDQVQSIYSGEITNWKSVGGADAEIKPYQRPVNSGSQTGMLSLVMKDKPLMEPLKENLLQTMAQIINYVSSYDNGKDSIGYSYYYYATTMFQTIDSTVANNIKLLGINGVKPNSQTIKDGTSPYTTAYYIVINKADGEDSPARKLANEMLSKRGQNVAKEAGYVPVN